MKTYVFRTHSDGGVSEVISGAYTPWGGFSTARFWQNYALTSDGPMTAAAASTAASWLVAGERIMGGVRNVWGRVVAFEVEEGEPITTETRTHTMVPAPYKHDGSQYTENPLRRLRGLRQLGASISQGIAPGSDYAQLSFVVNRKLGRRLVRWFPASVGPDDVLGHTLVRAAPGRAARYATLLRVEGTAVIYCRPWLRWMHQQVPELDHAVDVAPDGTTTRVADALPELLPGTITHKAQAARYQRFKSPAQVYLDTLLIDVDRLITKALRARAVDVFPFDRHSGKRRGGESAVLAAAALWQRFAAVLGYGYPSTAHREVVTINEPQGATLDTFGSADDPLIYDTYNISDPPPAQPAFPIAPAVLRLEAHKEEVFRLVNRLFGLHQWYFANIQTRPRRFSGAQWKTNAAGVPWHQLTAPRWFPFRTGEVWIYHTPDGVPNRDYWQQVDLHHIEERGIDQVYYYWRRRFDLTSECQRVFTLLNWERFGEMERWADDVVNTLNLLGHFLSSGEKRRTVTRKEMMMPIPSVPAAPATGTSSLPEKIEIVPYIAVLPAKQPPWMNRPGTEPESNRAYVYIPLRPLPATTSRPAPPRRSEYDETNEPEDYISGKAFLHGEARDWIDAYPSRGVFDGGLPGAVGSQTGGGTLTRPPQ